MNVNAIILETVQFLPHIRYYSLLLERFTRPFLVCLFFRVIHEWMFSIRYLLWWLLIFWQLALWKLLPNPSHKTRKLLVFPQIMMVYCSLSLCCRPAARPAWCWASAPVWAPSVTASPRPAPSTAPPPAPRPCTGRPPGPAPPPGSAPPPPATTSWWPWPTLQVRRHFAFGFEQIETVMERFYFENMFLFFFVALMPTFLYFLSTCKSLNSSNYGIEIYFSHLLLTTKDGYLFNWKMLYFGLILAHPHPTSKFSFLIWSNQSYWLLRPLMTSFSDIYWEGSGKLWMNQLLEISYPQNMFDGYKSASSLANPIFNFPKTIST